MITKNRPSKLIGVVSMAALSFSLIGSGAASAASSPVVTTIVNGASFFFDYVAPGSWMSVGGSGLASAPAVASTIPLPTTLGGVRVLVNGAAIPLVFVSPLQINAQLPYDTPLGTSQITVELEGVPSNAFPFDVGATAPGIFFFGDDQDRAAAQNVGDDGSRPVNTPDNPIVAGKSMVVYFTGQGPLDNPVPTGYEAPLDPLSRLTSEYSVTVGDEPAIVDFIGLVPGQIAIDQANIRIPSDLKAGDYFVVVTVGGRRSNPGLISVIPKP